MIRYLYKSIRSKELKEIDSYKPGSWIYVESPTDDEAAMLIEKFDLDPGHIDDARDEDEMPRLEREENLVYIFTRFAYTNDDLQVTTAPLLFVIGKEILMTISPRKIPRMEKFIEGKIDFSTTQRTKLVLQIMDQVVDQYEVFLNNIGRQIKTIRARLRVEEIRNSDFIQFVLIEDELNEFLSALTPTNAILRRLLLGKHIPLYAEDEDLVEDLLLNNEQSIEGCRSSLKSIVNIREAYSTIISNNLNQVIRILTVLTMLISVPMLVASIYGMNVALPFEKSPLAFSGIMTASLVLSIILLSVFRYKRWL